VAHGSGTVRAARPEDPLDLTTLADPVAGFLEARAAGRMVSLGTSGTTGVSRAVVRTTASWTASFAAVSALTGLGPASRVWVPGPLSGTMNLFGAVHAVSVGAARVDGPDRATHAHLTPTALSALLQEGTPVDGLVLVVAGDSLSVALHARAVAAGARVHHYYGAAELSFVAWGSHAGDLRPFPGADVSVRAGEVWVRSPYLCAGYDGPAGPLRRTRDGFATVGDRGRLDDGVLTVGGRPDALLVGGSTVETGPVEALLRGAASGEVAVVGVPHPALGAVLAVVLTSADDHARLLGVAREQLDGARRPRLWFLLERWPTTPAGKVDREALVALVSGVEGPARRLV
jgi:long-chain acyl-CoA synthetase